MTAPLAQAWIGLGSNDARDTALAAALTALAREHTLCGVSAVYASPCTRGSASEYWNLVASVETQRAPAALRNDLKALEARLGRVRGPAAEGRVRIDLDMLIMRDADGVPRAVGDLTPAHVLLPLAELLPAWRATATTPSLAEQAAATIGAPVRRFELPALAYTTFARRGTEETSC